MLAGIVLIAGAISAMCLYRLFMGRGTESLKVVTASLSRPINSKGLFMQVQPALALIERQARHWEHTRWMRTISARDERMIQQSGLSGSIEVSQVLALRVALGFTALCTGLLVILVWVFIKSLTVVNSGPVPVTSVFLIALCAALMGLWWPERWLKLRRIRRERSILRALPFMLDLLTLCVESGASLAAALAHTADKGPQGPLKEELQRMLQEVRAGKARTEALRTMAERMDLPAISNWVAAMISAQQQGSSLGPLLRAQADQRREERFLHAEKVAMKAPVKMLFPLLVFIFPCTFLLLFFPVAVRLVQEGLLR